MIDGKTVLAIIPARGGSKGVPRKNIREVAGKPLIAWTIEEAKKSKYIDRLILSSDDAEIIEVAKACGCEVPFVRPAELASDETPGIDPVLHALDTLPEYDWVVLLQPTSPMRTAEDIDGALEVALKYDSPSCVSVAESPKSPHWMYHINDGRLSPVVPAQSQYERRQDIPAAFMLNGAVYVARCDWLRENRRLVVPGVTVAYFMPMERSLDMDTLADLENACRILNSAA